MKLLRILRGVAITAASFLIIALSDAQSWATRYNHQNLDDIGECIAVDRLGNIYVAGTVDTSGEEDLNVVVHSYTSSGVARTGLWPAEYNGTGNGDDYATAIHVDYDGNIYVSGTSWGGSTTNYDFFVWKLDTAGNPVWPVTGGSTGYEFDSSGALRTTDTDNEGFTVDVGVKADMAVRESFSPENRTIALTGVGLDSSSDYYWHTVVFEQVDNDTVQLRAAGL